MKKIFPLFLILVLFFNFSALAQLPDEPLPPSFLNYCEHTVLYHQSPPALTNWYWQGTNPNGTDMSNSNQNLTVTSSGTYYLRAHNSSGWSVTSASATATIVNNPAIPSMPTIIQNCGNTIVQNAVPPVGINYFFEYEADDILKTGYASQNSLTFYTSQNIYIRAKNNNDIECWSPALTVPVTVISKPQMPVANIATVVTENSFTANWNLVTGANNYFLDVSTGSDFSSFVTGYNNLSVGNVNTHIVNGLTNGTEYFYRVKAFDGSCVSDNSNVISTHAFACNPTPEIYVFGLNNIIDDGNSSPDFAQNTKYGNVQLTNPVTHQFVIENKGETNLVLTGAPFVQLTGSEAAEFSVTTQPTSPILPGTSTSFEVTFTPTFIKAGNAPMLCNIEIPTNDPDVALYNFQLMGYGVDNRNGPFLWEGDLGFGWQKVLMVHRGLVKGVTIKGGFTGNAQFLFNNYEYLTPDSNYVPKWAAAPGWEFKPLNLFMLNTLKFDRTLSTNNCNTNIQNNNYYTFITSLNEDKDNSMSILESSFDPGNITNVIRQPIGFVYPSDLVTISVQLDHAPNVGEYVFVRWTNNNWATSSLTQVTSFSGTTGTALIPVQTAGTVVDYYALTTLQSSPDVNTIDYYSLTINNNTGNSNYQYVVKPNPVITMTDDGEIIEGAENGEIIMVSLNSGIFADPANISNWLSLNLPAGVTIGSVKKGCRANEIFLVLSGNSTIDYDSPITNCNISVTSDEIKGVGYTGANLTANSGVEFTPNIESATISSSICLSQNELSYATVNLNLSQDFFTDNILNTSNFTLNSAPAGLSVFNISYLTPQTANLVLQYTGSAISANTSFSVTINNSELFGNSNLTTNSLTINFITTPTITAQAICGSGQVTITATSSITSNVAFSYDGVNNVSSDNTSPFEFQTFILPEGSNITVYVRNTDIAGCSSDWVSTTAYANIIPSKPIITDDVICGTATYTLDAIIGNNGSVTDFSLNGSTISQSDNSAPFQYTTPQITEGSSLTVYARTTNPTTGCSSVWESCTITSQTISVAPTAQVNNNNFCEGAFANITFSYTGGTLGTGAVANWYDNATPPNLVGTGNNLTITAPTSTSTYNVVFEGTCNNTNPSAITVNVNIPSVEPTSANCSNTTFCSGSLSNITLTYTDGTLGTNAVANWYDDAGLTNLIGNGNNLNITAPASTTTYYIVFSGDCNTTSAQSVLVTVNTPSVVPATANVDNNNFCEGAFADITLSYTGGALGTGAVANWYDNAIPPNLIGTGNNLTISAPTSTTTYNVVFEGICNNTTPVPVTITVNSLSDEPTSVSCSDTEFCIGDISNLTLSYSGGTLGTSATAEWYDNSIPPNNIGTGNNLIISSPNTSITYSVIFEGLCNNTTPQSVNVIVNIPSQAPATANVDNNNFCEGDFPNITLSYTGGTLGTNATAHWYDNSTPPNNLGSGNNLTISSPLFTTTYIVVFEGTCNNTTPVPILVTVNSLSDEPTSVQCSNNEICIGEVENITLVYTGGELGTSATAFWYNNLGLTNLIGTNNNLTISTPDTTTTYYVVFDGLCGSTNPVSTQVNIYDFPEIEISNDTLINPFTEAYLLVTNNSDYIYLWTPYESLNDNSVYNPIATPSQTTDYVVEVTNQFGCTTTESVKVTLIDYEIVITTVITPNGDNQNDNWIVKYIDFFPENHVEIYNRQGIIVYQTDGYKNDWNGIYQETGEELPVGTYYFLLDLGDGTPTYKGSVTIIR